MRRIECWAEKKPKSHPELNREGRLITMRGAGKGYERPLEWERHDRKEREPDDER
jgi:hypothetical protein